MYMYMYLTDLIVVHLNKKEENPKAELELLLYKYSDIVLTCKIDNKVMIVIS